MGRLKAVPTPRKILAKIRTDDIDQVFLKNSLNIYEVCEGNSKNAESVRFGRRVN